MPDQVDPLLANSTAIQKQVCSAFLINFNKGCKKLILCCHYKQLIRCDLILFCNPIKAAARLKIVIYNNLLLSLKMT